MKLVMNISPREAVFLLGALTEIDQFQIRKDVGARRDPLALLHGLQGGRVRYRLADPDEHWQTRRETLALRHGDCEDLATGIAAELNETIFAGGINTAMSFGAHLRPPPLPRPPGEVKDPWVAWGNCPSASFGATPERAAPVAYKAKTGLFHVVVWTPTWGYLDPSVAGGMGSDYGASGQERARWLASNGPRAWRVKA
jgi:hypothetical protein